jgi:hypothetical protein
MPEVYQEEFSLEVKAVTLTTNVEKVVLYIESQQEKFCD